MATYFPVDGLQRATLGDITQDWTKLGWFNFSALVVGGQYHLYRSMGPGSSSFVDPYAGIFDDLNLNLYAEARNQAGDDQYSGVPCAKSIVDIWRHLTYRYKASTQEMDLLVNGVAVSPVVSIDLSGTSTPVLEYLCRYPGASSSVNGMSVAYVGDWQAWLTNEEILAQIPSPVPVRLTNLLSWDALENPETLGTWSLSGGPGEEVVGPLSTFCNALFCDGPVLPVGCIIDLD